MKNKQTTTSKPQKMSKERLTAFFDATLAIIMTILVLELDPPEKPTLEALWNLRMHFFSYALSFFWLGTMWIHQAELWSKAEYVTNQVMWWGVCLLFCSSLVPFATSFVNDFPKSSLPAIIYVGVTFLITLVNAGLNAAMRNANADDEAYVELSLKRQKKLRFDLLIKLIGLILAVVLPEYALIPVLGSLIYIIV